jgi:hypothetical protein
MSIHPFDCQTLHVFTYGAGSYSSIYDVQRMTALGPAELL